MIGLYCLLCGEETLRHVGSISLQPREPRGKQIHGHLWRTSLFNVYKLEIQDVFRCPAKNLLCSLKGCRVRVSVFGPPLFPTPLMYLFKRSACMRVRKGSILNFLPSCNCGMLAGQFLAPSVCCLKVHVRSSTRPISWWVTADDVPTIIFSLFALLGC